VVDAGMAHDKPLIIIADEYAHQALEKLFALPFFPSSVCSFLSLLCLSLLSSPRAGNVHPLLRADLWVLAKKRWILCLPQEKSPTALTV